jgi:hypothetical protein
MNKQNLTIYGVFMKTLSVEWEIDFYKRNKLSPDLIYIKQLELQNLKLVIRDLASQLKQ